MMDAFAGRVWMGFFQHHPIIHQRIVPLTGIFAVQRLVYQGKNIPVQKVKDNLVQLQREGFIKRSGKKLSIA